MSYLLFAAAFLVFGGIIALIWFKFPNKKVLIVERILVFIAIALFAVRFMCYFDVQIEDGWRAYMNFGPGDAGQKVLNTFGELCLWFGLSANIFLFLRPFFTTSTSKWYVKFISLPVIFFEIIFMYPMLNMMIGTHHTSFGSMEFVEYMLPIELGATFALAIYFFITDFKKKISVAHRYEVAIISTFGQLFSMPAFIPMFFFGAGAPYIHPLDLNLYHRIIMYVLLLIIPFLMYFLLRNHSVDKKRYLLIFFNVGIMLNFTFFNKYDVFYNPWDLPLHLCNTAVYILPICYIFMPKRLFYFTYFINVFGALLAILMPNYSDAATMFEPGVVRFWWNHMAAFYMPLMGVALHLFERPKLKQYGYSLIWFGLYFALAMTLNSVFTAIGHRTDYFFINVTEDGGNYIADKLGPWAQQFFEVTTIKFEVQGSEVVLHPIFQAAYFIVYVALGFGVWFVYALFFDIADSHYQLHIQLKGIKQEELALQSILDGRSLDEPMEKNAGISIELKDFSKKYGLNKYYSVSHANLEVKGGEVFGFLGHNGAGKSTIIKSIVGILPVKEGDIYVCGYNVKSQPVQAKSLIGFVPDHYALYEKLTAREYLNYIADIYEVSKEDRDARIKEYTELFELEGAIDSQIKTYSHGMKQKVTIIAALIHDPKVWILDEPLTGLDPASIFQVKECMRKHAAKGNIVFFSSHMIDIVEKLCDRIAVIKKGEIQAVKSVKEIEKSGTSLEQFYLKTIGDMRK